MVGAVCKTHQKELQQRPIIPLIQKLQNRAREVVLEGCECTDQTCAVGKAQTGQLQDSDQFFQQFEELAYYANIYDNEQVMLVQIKKATWETSKNTIYSANGEVPTIYEGWKARLLCMDYNWQLK